MLFEELQWDRTYYLQSSLLCFCRRIEGKELLLLPLGDHTFDIFLDTFLMNSMHIHYYAFFKFTMLILLVN